MADIKISKRRRATGIVVPTSGAASGAASGAVILKSSSPIPGPPGPVGPQGEQGLTGLTGLQGDRGFDAGISFLFDTATNYEDPGVGRIRFDNATPASVTNAYISIVDAFNNDIGTWIQSWDDVTGSVRGTLIFKENNTGQILIYNITGAITLEESSSSAAGDEGCCTIPLTYVAGTTMYEMMDLVMVQFVPATSGVVNAFQIATFADPLEIDASIYKDWICVVTGDTTINLNNAVDGDAGMLELIMDSDSSSGGSIDVVLGTMWTKKMGLTDIDGSYGADNIISWRKVGTDNVVYTIAQIEV